MKSGSSTSDSSVTCHESTSMAMSTSVTLTALERMEPRVEVKASCAPTTSLLRRLMSAPVWVRVKKPIDCRWTWA